MLKYNLSLSGFFISAVVWFFSNVVCKFVTILCSCSGHEIYGTVTSIRVGLTGIGSSSEPDETPKQKDLH